MLSSVFFQAFYTFNFLIYTWNPPRIVSGHGMKYGPRLTCLPMGAQLAQYMLKADMIP